MAHEIRNARHNGVGGIDLEWNHPERGWEWFTASPEDSVEYGRELFAQALAGPVAPFVPLTADELRQTMPAITRRQLRLALVRSGISLGAVEAAISSMPAGQQKDEAEIEWADAATFDRLHPTLLLVAAALQLSADQVDTLWAAALTI